MDRLGLITLQAEMREDLRYAIEASRLASERLQLDNEVGLESSAFQLVRFFNVIEQMGQRVVKSFENHIEDRQSWHAELIRRLSIRVPGVRPALYPAEMLPALQSLRGFRHVVTHAYDLSLDRDQQTLVVRQAEMVTRLLPQRVEVFIAEIAQEQGWQLA